MAIGKTVGAAVRKAGGWGSVIGTGFAGFSAVGEYSSSREKGYGVTTSVGRGVADFAVGATLGIPGTLALGAARTVPKAIFTGGEALNKMSRDMEQRAAGGAFANASFFDNQQTYTMRQAGMNLAKNSKYNLQNAMLGNEAQYL